VTRSSRVSQVARTYWLVAGASLLILDALQWMLAEAISAHAWRHPTYSYATNYISDLGVPDCGSQFQGRELCSPLHGLMNTSFVLQGVMFAAAVLLLSNLVAGMTRTSLVTLAGLHAIGFLLVGLFHGSSDGADIGLALHVGGAAVGIICANAIAIIVGVSRDIEKPNAYRWFSILVPSLGLLSEVLVGVFPAAVSGAFERAGVYSWILWAFATGTMLLIGRRSPMISQPQAR
jgi:hypothetical membrane protein